MQRQSWMTPIALVLGAASLVGCASEPPDDSTFTQVPPTPFPNGQSGAPSSSDMSSNFGVGTGSPQAAGSTAAGMPTGTGMGGSSAASAGNSGAPAAVPGAAGYNGNATYGGTGQ